MWWMSETAKTRSLCAWASKLKRDKDIKYDPRHLKGLQFQICDSVQSELTWSQRFSFSSNRIDPRSGDELRSSLSSPRGSIVWKERKRFWYQSSQKSRQHIQHKQSTEKALILNCEANFRNIMLTFLNSLTYFGITNTSTENVTNSWIGTRNCVLCIKWSHRQVRNSRPDSFITDKLNRGTLYTLFIGRSKLRGYAQHKMKRRGWGEWKCSWLGNLINDDGDGNEDATKH